VKARIEREFDETKESLINFLGQHEFGRAHIPSRFRQRLRAGRVGTSFEELQAYGLGYLKSAAQAECYRVFDKMVERASREMKRGLWPE
jgi:hypothetical protein